MTRDARPPRQGFASANSRAPGSPDLRRTLAAGASAILPGLGQLMNGRRRLAGWLILPILLLACVILAVALTRSPTRLLASLVEPAALSVVLLLNVVLLGWRLAAVGHAYFDRRYPVRSGPAALVGLGIILAVVVIPHGVLHAWGTSAQTTFARVFTAAPQAADDDGLATEHPELDERVNILLIGIDKTPGRTATLTDTMMVVSVDPVARTVTMVSLPRDLVRVPMGNGDVFAPKLNSLMAYADRHPKRFPEGGTRALEEAVGALLGIPIHYYIRIDFFGFVKLVDAVGGVDIDVTKAFYDAEYDGMGVNTWPDRGWGVTVGRHHFNGWQALAYARARKADGESDFTRAARQQEILLALRSKVMTDGSLLLNLPTLLDAFGDLAETDIPTSRLPDLAAVADELSPSSIIRTVLRKPLTRGGMDPTYGSIQIPDVAAIQAVALTLFPPPGSVPIPWPSPVPPKSPAPSDQTGAPD